MIIKKSNKILYSIYLFKCYSADSAEPKANPNIYFYSANIYHVYPVHFYELSSLHKRYNVAEKLQQSMKIQ